jgi:hypothetical protein
LGLAQDTQYLSQPGEISTNPVLALKQAQKFLDTSGIKVVPKADGIEAWTEFTTTFPDTVYVSKDFPTLSVAEQAAILWHEIVHVRQYEALGLKVFFAHYSFAEGRWALEVQAYRESFRVRRVWGEDDQTLRSGMLGQAERLYSGYELGAMPKNCAVDLAIEVWSSNSL